MTMKQRPGAAAPDEREWLSSAMTRHSFVGGVATSIGVTATGPASWERGMAARPGSGMTRYPQRIPPTIGAGYVSLTAAPGPFDLGGGKISQALAYNGLVPGPTVVANQGDTATINFSNGFAERSNVHYHGLIVPTATDGGPLYPVAPGSGYQHQFPMIQRVALYWYRPHAHMLTGKQVNLGLAGAFVVRDAEEAALNLPSGAYEVSLNHPRCQPRQAGQPDLQPDDLRVQRRESAGERPSGSTPRCRAGGVSLPDPEWPNARIFRIALSNGAPVEVIGNDSGLLPAVVQVADIEVGNGERLDVLVGFGGVSIGTKILLRDLNSGWELLEFNMARNSATPGTLPTGTLSSISAPFDGISRINSLTYDMTRVDVQVPLNDVELWRLSTGGNAPHPIHVHGASFQVVARSGGRNRLFPWEASWKDTGLLLDQETVDLLVRFDAYREAYVMHRHKLAHEDMGMMKNFDVV